MVSTYLAEPGSYKFVSPSGYFYIEPFVRGRTRFEISTEFRGNGVASLENASLHKFAEELRNMTFPNEPISASKIATSIP